MNYLNNPNYTRGIRNNNPGNLVRSANNWQGKIPYSNSLDAHFEQFVSMKYGIRAMMRDIISDYSKGKTTVTALISEFAPAFENNTAAYINSVVTGIGANIIGELTKEKLILICKAIVKVENGADAKYISSQDYEAAYNILGIKLKQNTDTTTTGKPSPR